MGTLGNASWYPGWSLLQRLAPIFHAWIHQRQTVLLDGIRCPQTSPHITRYSFFTPCRNVFIVNAYRSIYTIYFYFSLCVSFTFVNDIILLYTVKLKYTISCFIIFEWKMLISYKMVLPKEGCKAQLLCFKKNLNLVLMTSCVST